MTLLLALVVAAAAQPAPNPKLGVLIVIDQLGTATFDLRKPEAGIKRMLEQGLHVKECRYETAPTLTSVGHATLSTGSYPQTHGIIGNAWWDTELNGSFHSTQDENFQIVGRPPAKSDGTSPRFLRAATIGDSLKTWRAGAKVVSISGKDRSAILMAGRSADAVFWVDGASGFFVSSNFYLKELPPFVDAVNKSMLSNATIKIGLPGGGITGANPQTPNAEHATLAHDAELNERFDWQPLYEKAEVDLALASVDALELGKDEVPDLLMLSFASHDFIAHERGPEAPELAECFKRIDFQIGRLFDALDQKVGKGRWVAVLSADHGGSPNPDRLKERRIDAGRVQGKVLKEALEAEADAALGKNDWFNGWYTPGVSVTPALRGKIHGADDRFELAAKKLDGIATLISAKRLFEPHTYGALGPLYRAGFYAGRSPEYFFVTKPNWIHGSEGASHGTPHLYDRQVPAIFLGPGVAKGTLEFAEPIDIAPTLSRLIGAPSPANAQGKALVTQPSR